MCEGLGAEPGAEREPERGVESRERAVECRVRPDEGVGAGATVKMSESERETRAPARSKRFGSESFYRDCLLSRHQENSA